jgi:phosphatidylglycerol lysyltransferase
MENKQQQWKNRVENAAIVTILVLEVVTFFVAFLNNAGIDRRIFGVVAANLMVERMISLIIIICAVNLFKRRRGAWIVTAILIPSEFLIHFFINRYLELDAILILEGLAWVVLMITWRDFSRPSVKIKRKTALWLFAVVVFCLFLTTAAGYYEVHNYLHLDVSFWEAMKNQFMVLFGVMPMTSGHHGMVRFFGDFSFWFCWISIVGCVLLMVKPLVVNPSINKADQEHALALVRQFGQNPESYLAIEDDKLYFFGTGVEGVLAYGIRGDNVIVLGDPIAAPGDISDLLQEFKVFCINSHYNAIFLGTTDDYIDVYQKHGYHVVKCGEEARFNLQEYNLKGGKAAKVRAAFNHATKAGIVVDEYKPLENRDFGIEAELKEVSGEWLDDKNSTELTFTLGTLALDEPLDRRYFYARSEEGRMEAFIVYIPYACMNGYMADVTRRRKSAPNGVMQKIMVEAFATFRDEGIQWGSMGLAPLAGLNVEGIKPDITTRMLCYAYEHFNDVYGFKDLFTAKKRYNPSLWVPGYFVYSTRILTPAMGIAVADIQNPGGIMDYVKSFFEGRSDAKEAKRLKAEKQKANNIKYTKGSAKNPDIIKQQQEKKGGQHDDKQSEEQPGTQKQSGPAAGTPDQGDQHR